MLLAQYPDTKLPSDPSATRRAKAKAERPREDMRLASLCPTNQSTVPGASSFGPEIYAKDDIDTDGRAPSRCGYFRDHTTDWGRSSYLVLQAGDFDCYGSLQGEGDRRRCRAEIDVRHSPEDDEAIAMFIDDERARWAVTKAAKRLSVEFPVKAGGTRTAVFEVGGLDERKITGVELSADPAA